MVFGENRGYYSGDAPRRRLPGSMWESSVDAGKARACREMHEQSAITAAPIRGSKSTSE
jgi:hypothetical protein